MNPKWIYLMFYNTEINTIYDDKLQTIPNLFNDGTSVESHDTHPMIPTDTLFKGELQNNQMSGLFAVHIEVRPTTNISRAPKKF
ncbi:hypothetical protein X798_03104 [Onchocerca flexuosa]|uniref:Uncharacterized protein n=1 Tax=Onchocerca flexuosa TaxID=387005 RepID=A0A238BWQ5_9BILA|nr:hypothetical protein X798_03104 [Onchocerca flexuosa]